MQSSYPQSISVSMPGQQGGSKETNNKDFLVWSLFNFLLFWNCFCLGFLALVFSIKSRDRMVFGEADRAAAYAKRAKYLNIAALVIGIVGILIFIVVIITTPTIREKLHDLFEKA
ncbi:interferon-induced transmembrane protein 2-like [Hemicordylus capensis]|uniref:interferon-induced transmembrane protein 2-like n=1 Tax=Hemicordylus capensis TaxID=884348 RepID=UPI002302F4CD|nr:interferon-induced transmembrane protein 2-like [Hemicordylus capensis]